jgi:hypothetical protein
MIEDSPGWADSSPEFLKQEPICGEEIQGTMHLHRCRMSFVPGHLHCCYCGAFWPLSQFEKIASESAKELYECLF